MMKTLMAFATFCVAGLASAVNYDWTGWSSQTVTANSSVTIDRPGDNSAKLGDGTGFSVALVFSGQPGESVTNLLRVGFSGSFGGDDGPWAAVTKTQISAKNAMGMNTDTGYSGENPNAGNRDVSMSFDSGDNILAITVETFGGEYGPNTSGDANTNMHVTYTFWLNGEKLGQLSHTDVGAAKYDWNTVNIGGMGGTLYIKDGVADMTASPVPEPTTLALLALGVAGLALRRKAA